MYGCDCDSLPPDVASFGSPENGGYLYKPGEVLVPPDAPPDVAGSVERAGGRRDGDFEPFGVRRYVLSTNVDAPTLVAELRKEFGVRAIGPNHVVVTAPRTVGHPATTPVPAAPRELPDGDGDGPRVLILDTGLYAAHPALQGRAERASAGDEEALDTNRADSELDRAAGHGTFAAGVVLQVEPSALVLAARVIRSDGFGFEADVVQRLAGIGALEPQIVNCSFGGPTADDAGLLALEAAIGASGEDVVWVASAGNDHEARPIYPAAFTAPNVIGVAAVDADPLRGGWQLAWFSNFGPWVDLYAPGVDLTSTFVDWHGPIAEGAPGRVEVFDGWARWSGTSFAAPVVAGLLARALRGGAESARAAAKQLRAGRPLELRRGPALPLADPLA